MKLRFEGKRALLHRTLLKCALRGWTLQRDADKIQAALDRASKQAKGGNAA